LRKRALAGDAEADAALCLIASKYLLLKREMPDNLLVYTVAILRERYRTPPRRGRGGDKYANLARNLFILGAVERLKKRGFKPTRNREPSNDPQESGCSIVAQALQRIGIPTTELGVEEVWRNREALRAIKNL
jgi:hypothetical protein